MTGAVIGTPVGLAAFCGLAAGYGLVQIGTAIWPGKFLMGGKKRDAGDLHADL